jgi:pyridoxamine 5'-phosphate oxidase family protein
MIFSDAEYKYLAAHPLGRLAIVTLDPPLVAAFSNETLRIHPRRIIAWNIDEPGPASPGRLPHMQGYNSRNVSR